MQHEYEAFYAADLGKVGAIVRIATADTLRTRTAFGTGDSLFLVDQVTRHSGDIRDWNCFTFTDHGQELSVHGERTADGILIDGRRTELPADAIPSYLNQQLARTALTEPDLSFVQFSELGTEPTPTTVRLGHDRAAPPWGEPVDCRTVQLITADGPGITFWFADAEDPGEQLLIMSDWQGARSYPTRDRNLLLDGLDPEVSLLINDFLDA